MLFIFIFYLSGECLGGEPPVRNVQVRRYTHHIQTTNSQIRPMINWVLGAELSYK